MNLSLLCWISFASDLQPIRSRLFYTLALFQWQEFPAGGKFVAFLSYTDRITLVPLSSYTRTPEEQFECIESILLQNTSQIATLLEAQLKNEQLMAQLQAAQQRTQEQLDEFTRDTRASIEDLVQFGMDTFELVAENSTDIRGLQIENRRILRELRDRRRDDQR